MANTYTQLYIHIVFAVRGRDNLIKPDHKEEIHKYITGIIQHRDHKLLAINSMPDHVHILIGYDPKTALSDLVRDIKAASSKFINEAGWLKSRFAWQEGYGAFSYSRSQLDDIIRYIATQEEHHKNKLFREEYFEMLEKFHVDFDPKYLFEWIEG
jgi:REP element-mobilizing transposase RayT